MDKSHVGLGIHICPFCCEEHTTSVLLDRTLKKSLEHKNYLGWEPCEKCKTDLGDGYSFLVSIDEEKSTKPFKLDTIYCTGNVLRIRHKAYKGIFGEDHPKNNLTFCDDGLVKKLQEMVSEEE